MSDVVVTVPKRLWAEWIEEGDLPGEPYDGSYEYSFYVSQPVDIRPGERVYIVAHDRLRGYAPLVRVDRVMSGYALIRHGGAVAVTIPEPIVGFRGVRKRWWERDAEMPFEGWRQPDGRVTEVRALKELERTNGRA